MSKPLISIIIPVYNRANLIAQTLESISVQSYMNWECIIVDDDSTDKTVIAVQVFCDKDSRFKLYHRPSNRLKGGNAARNHGFEVSRGEFVNWFDSDDLMERTFIEDKLNVLLNKQHLGFVISKSINFYPNGTTNEFKFYANNLEFELTADNFILEKSHWITNDLLIRKKSVGDVRFDETLLSGQEYNFFIRLLSIRRPVGIYLNKILSKHRIHNFSIQELQKGNKFIVYKNKYLATLKAYEAVNLLLNENTRKYLMNRILIFSYFLISNKNELPLAYMFLKHYNNKQGKRKSLLLLFYYFILFVGADSYSIKKMLKVT